MKTNPQTKPRIWLRLFWLLPLFAWLAISPALLQTAFAYDGNQTDCSYDWESTGMALPYDQLAVLTRGESTDSVIGQHSSAAVLGQFFAAERAGLETRGLRPLPGTRQIPEGIPDNWRIRPTKGEGGTWYYDPANKGNAVRLMQGDPPSPFPNSQAPYIRWQQNGQALDINGNVVPKNTPDAPIPLQDFQFNPDLFK